LSITQQPQNQTVFVSQSATLTVTAVGGSPLSYQWYKGESGDTTNPVGVASSNPSINQISSVVGRSSYWVRVKDPCNRTIDSQAALLVITDKRPLIFIPGVTGSYLDDDKGVNLWPHGSNEDKLRLSLDPSETGNQATVQVTDVLRSPTFCTFTQDVYQTLISKLTTTGGYREDSKESNPTLFVFAYDWRLSNDELSNAHLLKTYIDYVRGKYPGTDVDILTHSMGGLLARRYIITNRDDHHIKKLITVAAPWLGAPKAIKVMNTGEWFDGFWGTRVEQEHCVIKRATLKKLVEFFPSIHQLLPSQYYYNLGGTPFQEDGWDINENGNSKEDYNPVQLIQFLNDSFRSAPGNANNSFHTEDQDNERKFEGGISYFHIYGVQTKDDTIRRVVARKEGCVGSFCLRKYLDYLKGPGDGTVPQISAERNNDFNSLGNVDGHNMTQIRAKGDLAGHVWMLSSNPDVYNAIANYLDQAPSQASSAFVKQSSANATETEPSYYVRVLGVSSVTIADTLGHSATPLGDSSDSGIVPDVTSNIMADDAVLMVLPTDQTYTITMKLNTTPLSVRVTRGTDSFPDHAIRYQDIVLPAGVTAILKITPQGIENLRYDRDALLRVW